MFYYGPGKLAIARDSDGRPEIRFLQMRYTGTAATGDQGRFMTRSILSFRVQMAGTGASALAAARSQLTAERLTVRELRPLPIRRVEATLNYTPLADTGSPASAGGTKEARPVGSGALEEGEAAQAGEGFWSERVFTIAPDPATSQALWTAMSTGKVALSLSYSFATSGIVPQAEVGGVPKEVADKLAEPKTEVRTVAADTVAITVDAARIPECLKQIDINESVPPGYAALSVYCFDFNNALRPDLLEKTVEIRATSVSGKPVLKSVTFAQSTPDLYSATARFRFALSMKAGYQYRLREITPEGEVKVTPWREGKPWSQLLDVTTPPDERPRLPETNEEGKEP